MDLAWHKMRQCPLQIFSITAQPSGRVHDSGSDDCLSVTLQYAAIGILVKEDNLQGFHPILFRINRTKV